MCAVHGANEQDRLLGSSSGLFEHRLASLRQVTAFDVYIRPETSARYQYTQAASYLTRPTPRLPSRTPLVHPAARWHTLVYYCRDSAQWLNKTNAKFVCQFLLRRFT